MSGFMKNSLLISLIILFLASSNIVAQSASLSGFVTDSTNGEALIGANVYLHNQPIGISSNEIGYYVLHPVPPDTYTI